MISQLSQTRPKILRPKILLGHDSLKIIEESFNIRKYYTVSSVISRLKQLLKKDKMIKKRIESVKDLINKYQEQT